MLGDRAQYTQIEAPKLVKVPSLVLPVKKKTRVLNSARR
jgi:hypothetical protein